MLNHVCFFWLAYENILNNSNKKKLPLGKDHCFFSTQASYHLMREETSSVSTLHISFYYWTVYIPFFSSIRIDIFNNFFCKNFFIVRVPEQLYQAAQGVCGISSGNTQDLPRHFSVPSTVGNLLSREVGVDDLQGSFPNPPILWFSNY